MRVRFPSIFPNKAGNLVIGPYPHRVRDTQVCNGQSFLDPNRQPFLVVEAVDDAFVCRAAGPDFESVAGFVFFGPNRWVVWPADCSLDSSVIYG